MNHLKIIFIFVFIFFLQACSNIPYKKTIEQGNLITPEMLSQLRTGMTSQQVRYIMGTPVLTHSFDLKRWDYVYSLRKTGAPTKIECITLHFSNNILQKIEN
ncbi:MAG: hypothetical protein A3I12_04995 [Gammaproteobacteria bacterium RIFCSPLOWO2_02_FULL_38_11]|nr:MAG: hypothetical protein A3B69_04980 [Gammaproteobacteria bacterium RIFCSPHIGHO2_02_FULL_38_33]OGT24046.1 MAG: hypothetical protein A2W47_06865 [Gammaproteobacteria bacterium RIFCSPHIGHO2_12_38_15]OGT67683.1 MAG: hypothetical protein A3I12_04995 [Gammaproteobacteria bacterium RIFCSPLOWO2_02_FULL_38_11]OGT75777.1 MAG: hypothetical protein A3G71_06880 [Gammaproteobacteria bacterium RIFCSPLOWO2_12_FULL_38_14]